MNDDTYGEILNRFKQNEKPEVVLIIAENPELVKIVIGWTTLDVHHVQRIGQCVGGTDFEIWEWLWANTVYDLKKLKEIIGTPVADRVFEKKKKCLKTIE